MGLYRRGRTWYIDYRFGGKRYREAVGPNKKLAAAAMAKRTIQIAENRFLGAVQSLQATFDQLSKVYLDWARVNKRSAERDGRSIRRLARSFGGWKLTQITPLAIERYKNERSHEVSRSTVNRELACLKHMFSKAVAWGMASDNPVKKVRLFREPPGRVRFLSLEEIRRLLAASAPHLRPIIMIALLTGMRKGEILQLEWDDLDFDRQLLHVRDSKNGEDRRIAMSGEAEAILRELPRVHKRVFTRPGKVPVRDIRTCFENAVARAGIEDFSFHDLRHTFASYMVMNGVEIVTVSRILGHKTLDLTLRYAHLSPAYQREAMERLRFDGGHKTVTGAKIEVAGEPLSHYRSTIAGVVEQVDTRDLKSLGL